MAAPQGRWEQHYDEPPRGRGGCFWALIFLILVAGLVVGLLVAFPNAPGVAADSPRLVYLVVLLAVLAVSVGVTFAENPGQSVRFLAIWVAIASGIALLYVFRGEFGIARDRVIGSAMPAQGVATVTPTEKTVTLFAQGGHFLVEAEVGSETVLFMIDTGASDVALSRTDAQRLGITPPPSAFTRVYQTANGQSRGAPVTLDSVAIGPIDLRYVEASVVEGELGISLLGMSFLNRLAGYQVTGDRLVLRQ
ncbi:MAG: TIGR02281 family clan AA aspartic protease [Sphingomonadales bacterium]